MQPITRMRMAMTTNVYGRRNANLTIHILESSGFAIAPVVPERLCFLTPQTWSEQAYCVRPEAQHRAAMARSRRLCWCSVNGMTLRFVKNSTRVNNGASEYRM